MSNSPKVETIVIKGKQYKLIGPFIQCETKNYYWQSKI
jgi:hypothetical protein